MNQTKLSLPKKNSNKFVINIKNVNVNKDVAVNRKSNNDEKEDDLKVVDTKLNELIPNTQNNGKPKRGKLGTLFNSLWNNIKSCTCWKTDQQF